MKKIVFAGLMLFTVLIVYGQAKIVMLDEAIRGAVEKILDDFAEGQTIVVYQFRSPNQNKQLSDHILNELFVELFNSRNYIVLSRVDQEVIDAEIDYQYNKSANMINDDSLAKLTKRIGAQAILTGSLDDAVNYYSFKVRVIGTETIAALAAYTAYVDKNDKQIAGFLGHKSTSQKLITGAQNIALGLGSYFEGDTIGGITISAGYVLAIGLIVIDKVALDWDSPMVGVPSTIGVVAAGLTLAYGFVRPFIYNRAPRVTAILDNAKTNIVTVQDATGNRNTGFQATYTIKF